MPKVTYHTLWEVSKPQRGRIHDRKGRLSYLSFAEGCAESGVSGGDPESIAKEKEYYQQFPNRLLAGICSRTEFFDHTAS